VLSVEARRHPELDSGSTPFVSNLLNMNVYAV
jgi:hypothetical protein